MPTYFEDITSRGYEAGPSRRVPLPMVFQYMEHLRWRCIIDPASGLAPFVDQGYFFVVQKQRLVLHRAFGQDTDLRVYLMAGKIGRSAIDLTHEVRRRSDGALIASAEVTGLWLGPNRRLCRIPDALRSFATELEGPPEPTAVQAECHADRMESSYIRPPEQVFPARGLDIEAPTEADVPSDALAFEVLVRPSDLDIFAHVNAATYLRFCDDARAAAEGVWGAIGRAPACRAAIHYARETLEGEVLTVRSWRPTDTELSFALFAGGVLRASARMEMAPGA